MPAVHHDDPVDQPRHHAEVVGDPDGGHAEFPAKLVDERQDLLLDGDIQGSGRLVGDEHPRAHGQSARDHHALAHAAREFMGVRARGPLGVGNADPGQQFEGSGAGRRGIDAVCRHRFGDLRAHAHQRVE